MRRRISEALRLAVGVAMLAGGLASGTAVSAKPGAQVGPGGGQPVQTGRIEWGLWIDPDGCMHWWADGGLEGYMVPRRDPKTGKAVCLKLNTCLVENTDTLFATDSHHLTAQGRQRLEHFFRNAGAFGYAIYGHTDSRASDEYNMRLSERRAKSVAAVAQSVGASVERVEWFGERQPRATNATAEGMRQNRRVEVVCYRW
ncbi:MAG: OmpA family protein [Gemmobacter sp.]|uniref:OmpA family protein n=1 Tax=Gemmobacter sp. TaxID=1898957 RepID=UPI00391E0265